MGRSRHKRGCYVTERILYDDDYRKRLLVWKRFIDENGHARGKPIPIVLDVEHSKALFNRGSKFDPRCKTLNHWVCPFRVKWSRYKAEVKPKRKRLSPELVEARALSQAPFTPNTLADERRLVSQYCRDKSSKVLAFKSRNDDVFAKPYEYRFSQGRVARVRRRVRENVKPKLKHIRGGFLFMTLTVSTRRFKSQYEAYQFVRSRWNKTWTAIRNLFPRDRRPVMIRSFEVQENGVGYHVHALLCGVSFINADWLRKIWGEPNKRSVHLEHVRNWKQAYNYVLKYNLKDVTADENGEGLSVSQIVNMSVGARSYAMSRYFSLGNSTHNSNRDSSQDVDKWVFLGVMDLETYNRLSVSELLRYFGCGPPCSS